MNSSSKDEDFLSRWSKRKQAVKEAEAREEQQAAETAEVREGQLPAQAEGQDQLPVPTEEDVEKLTADSDFTGFLKEHVPEHIKRLALRKLWASDPVFGILDGLNEYDDDYTKVQLITQAATSYKIGRGYQPEEPVEEDEGEALASHEDGAAGEADEGEAETGEETAEVAEAAESGEEQPEHGDGAVTDRT